MTFLLLLAPNMSERQRAGLHRRLAEAFPELTIERAASAAEAEPHIARADILMAYNIPDELAAKARSLKWIQSLASGTDGFLSRPSLPKAPTITRMQNVAAVPVSEGAVALMLALAHRLPTALQAQQRKHWDQSAFETTTLVAGKIAGILGVGQIAELLAPKLKALGMTVIGLSARSAVPGFDAIRPSSELIATAPSLDFLVVLAPLKPETRGMVNAAVFRAMKPTAFFVNVSRGALVDEPALVEALRSGTIAGAALDVFTTEPLPSDSPLWSMPNVIVMPHATAGHVGYIDDIFPLLQANMRRYLAGDIDNMQYIVRRGSGEHHG